MTRSPRSRSTAAPSASSRKRRRRAGKADAAAANPKPHPGWNTQSCGYFINPRPPAVTASLAPELNLERYFAAAAVMGLLASQIEEPDQDWAARWALEIGERMAKDARKRQA